MGGREGELHRPRGGSEADDSVTGTLKGYDQLMNLVMDDVVEEYESEHSQSVILARAHRQTTPCPAGH